MNETNGTRVAAAAASVLGQTIDILKMLSDEQYAAQASCLQGSTAGQHTRHLLDHFAALAEGHEGKTDAVCYDRRQRGTNIESVRAAAAETASELSARLAHLDEVQLAMPVMVRVMVDAAGEEVELESTLVRELAFVTHHAVHHLAMIRAIACEHGLALGSEVGRAPSTLHNENGTASGADVSVSVPRASVNA